MQPIPEPGSANTPAAEVVSEIRRGASRLARRLRAERSADGLSGLKLQILAHLHSHGPSSPSDIATAERHQPQSLTRSLAALTGAGLIRRSPSETDGRQSILSLTETGTLALRADMDGRDKWLAQQLFSLTDLEVLVLHEGAKIMNRLA